MTLRFQLKGVEAGEERREARKKTLEAKRSSPI